MKKFLSITGAFVAGAYAYAHLFSPAPRLVQAADNPPSVRYFIFETTEKGGRLLDPMLMVEALDKLAAEGWRVKTGVGDRLILEK